MIPLIKKTTLVFANVYESHQRKQVFCIYVRRLGMHILYNKKIVPIIAANGGQVRKVYLDRSGWVDK